MSDDEVEKFEITDYDLENEFNVNRRSRKLTKNERIYGIWAPNEEEHEEPSRRASFKGSKRVKNYTAAIGFIAGGIQQAGKNEEETKKESDEEEDEGMPTFGLGLRKSRRIRNSSSEESEEEMPSNSEYKQLYNSKSVMLGNVINIFTFYLFNVVIHNFMLLLSTFH